MSAYFRLKKKAGKSAIHASGKGFRSGKRKRKPVRKKAAAAPVRSSPIKRKARKNGDQYELKKDKAIAAAADRQKPRNQAAASLVLAMALSQIANTMKKAATTMLLMTVRGSMGSRLPRLKGFHRKGIPRAFGAAQLKEARGGEKARGNAQERVEVAYGERGELAGLVLSHARKEHIRMQAGLFGG
jgi:hypothetical protein